VNSLNPKIVILAGIFRRNNLRSSGRRQPQLTSKANQRHTHLRDAGKQRVTNLAFTALDELPDAYQRDRGFAQACLALAYAGMREYDSAAAQATSALSIARSSGSLRTMHETVSAVNALGEGHTSQAVSQLFDAIKEEGSF
jgi:hypothetical protein